MNLHLHPASSIPSLAFRSCCDENLHCRNIPNNLRLDLGPSRGAGATFLSKAYWIFKTPRDRQVLLPVGIFIIQEISSAKAVLEQLIDQTHAGPKKMGHALMRATEIGHNGLTC